MEEGSTLLTFMKIYGGGEFEEDRFKTIGDYIVRGGREPHLAHPVPLDFAMVRSAEWLRDILIPCERADFNSAASDLVRQIMKTQGLVVRD